MGLLKHLANGIISVIISVVITVALADEEDGPWGLGEVALSVAITAFFSGFFTSYFAK